MKKYIILTILTFSIFSQTNAFFGDPSSLDLYKNIDSGFEEMQEEMLDFELRGADDNILKEINNLAYLNNVPECINDSLSIDKDDMREIATKENVAMIADYVDNNCLDSSSNRSLQSINSYLNIFKTHFFTSEELAKKKTEGIYKMYHLGIFSDGILENSGFDLMTDIENIDKIIFNNDTIYEGEEDVDIESEIEIGSKNQSPAVSVPYKKKTDNSEFGCSDFYCNSSESKSNDTGGGGENENTVEFLVTRSNEHLKTFAAQSLVQAKMTTDQYELGLKDLDMPSTFHLSAQVKSKSVPVLDIEDEGKKDETEFSWEKMLQSHYKKNGLDYERRNDLILLRGTEAENQSIINSEDLTIGNPLKKFGEFNYQYLEKENNKIGIINKTVEKKVNYGIIEIHEKQFVEINKYTSEIHNYVEHLHSILKKMLEIPVDGGSN